MNSRFHIFPVVCACLFLLCGCDMYVATKVNSYVLEYVYMEGISLARYDDLGCNEICMDMLTGDKGIDGCGYFLDADKEKYESLCRKHSDQSYRNTVYVYGKSLVHNGTRYGQKDFMSLTVTADKDFDAEHGAGTSLNDLIRFVSFSPYPFIKSGYRDCFNYTEAEFSEPFKMVVSRWFGESIFSQTKATVHPIDKMLDEITQEDMILLGYDNPSPICFLCFEKQPSEPGTYLITVELNSDEGDVYVATTTADFI